MSVNLYDLLTEDEKFNLKNIENKAAEYLSNIVVTFPEYTDHSIQHSKKIIDILDRWLLDQEQKSFLEANRANVFFLYAAAYLHDIGMIHHPSLQYPEYATNKEDIKNYIRTNHHQRSYEFIINNWKELRIEDEFQAKIIAIIALGHREIKLTDDLFITPRPYKSGISINTQFLSACIRIGDELDMDFDRVSYNIFEMIEAKNEKTISEWKKHFAIGGVAPHAHYPATIHVICECYDYDTHRCLKKHESKIVSMLNEVNKCINPRFKFSNIIYDINCNGYIPVDYKFRIDSYGALKIFIGKNLYKDERVFIRELIQNSFDACNYNIFNDTQYNPEVTINFDYNDHSIEISDNGIGMNREWIEKYFLTVGLSFYQSKDCCGQDTGGNISRSFIGKFGIGFLSCFMVAKKIVIKTQKKDSPHITMTISDVSDYFIVDESTHIKTYGTQIKLFLNCDISIAFYFKKLISYIKSNVKYSTIPIILKNNGIKFDMIEKNSLTYEDEGLVNIITTKLDFDNSEGYLCVKPIFDADYKTEYYCEGGVSIFQDGIYICQNESIFPHDLSKYIIGRVNYTGIDKLNLSLDRNNILFENNDILKMQKNILKGSCRLLNKLVTNYFGKCDIQISKMTSSLNLSYIDDNEFDSFSIDFQSILKKHLFDTIIDNTLPGGTKIKPNEYANAAILYEFKKFKHKWHNDVMVDIISFIKKISPELVKDNKLKSFMI